jgi:hypothetical protein
MNELAPGNLGNSQVTWGESTVGSRRSLEKRGQIRQESAIFVPIFSVANWRGLMSHFGQRYISCGLLGLRGNLNLEGLDKNLPGSAPGAAAGCWPEVMATSGAKMDSNRSATLANLQKER